MSKKRRTTVYAGNFRAVCAYTSPVINDSPKARAAKRNISTEARKRINKRTKTRQVEYLLYANFINTDYFITLTYNDENLPKTRTEAKNNIRMFIKSLRAARKKTEDETKYIYSTEDKHETGRYHHHIILNRTNRNDVEDILSLWDLCQENGIHIELLASGKTEGKDFRDIASYLVKEEKPIDEQSYTTSRNLIRPERKTEWIDESEDIDIPENAEIVQGSQVYYENEYGYFHYVEYIINQKNIRQNE